MLILYTVKLTVLNNATNNLVIFNKNFESEITVSNDNILYDNYHTIHNSVYVLDLFSQEIEDYCIAEQITNDNIIIDEYEIVTLTENVEVFFENSIDPTAFTLTPDIKCYVYPKELPLPVPTLHGTAYDSNSIIWTWPEDEQYAHYLISEPIDINSEGDKTKIIATLPIGSKHYIETGLEPNTAYSRRLINYTDTQTSLPSGEVTVVTETVNPQISIDKYYIEREHDWSITDSEREIVQENLEAFKSGIGDLNDLKVYKQMDNDFYEKFKGYFTLTGKYTQREKRYDQVGFKYKVCLEATETIEEQEGGITFKLDAYPWQEMYKTEYVWATKPVTVYAKVYGEINLFKENLEPDVVEKTITWTENVTTTLPTSFILSLDLSSSMKYDITTKTVNHERMNSMKEAAKTAIDKMASIAKEKGISQVQYVVCCWAADAYTIKTSDPEVAKKAIGDKINEDGTGGNGIVWTGSNYTFKGKNIGTWTDWGTGLVAFNDYADLDVKIALFFTDGFANEYSKSSDGLANGKTHLIAPHNPVKASDLEGMQKYIVSHAKASVADAIYTIFSCEPNKMDWDYKTDENYNRSIMNSLNSVKNIGTIQVTNKDAFNSAFEDAVIALTSRSGIIERSKKINVTIPKKVVDYKSVIIETEPLAFTFDSTVTPVEYKETLGKAEVVSKLTSTKMSEKSILQLLKEAKEQNYWYKQGYTVSDTITDEDGNVIGDVYKNIFIKDTYMYGDEDIVNLDFNNFDYGMMGTVNVNATIPNLSTEDNTDDEYVASDDSFVWISGYTNAIIYDCKRYGHVMVNSYNKPQETIFFKDDLATLLKNRKNENIVYGNENIDSEHVFKKELTLKTPDPNYMQILSDGIDDDMIVTIDKHWESPVLDYKFNLSDPLAYTPYHELLPDCNPDSQDKHVIILTVYRADNVEINSNELNDNYYESFDYTNPAQNPLEFKYGLNSTWSYANNIYDSDGHWINQYLRFFARKMKKTQDYYDELPREGMDSLYGLVNGKYKESNLSGKQDLIVQVPHFNIPSTVLESHADSVKIYIRITEFQPDNALVSYKWKNESPVGSGYTNVNGDYVTFSSDAITYKDVDYYETLATYETPQIEMFNQEPLEIMQTISKPNSEGSEDKYSNYYLHVETDNADVLATRYPEEIVFGDESNYTVPVTYKGVVNSTSKWSPRIHNGYYYINQHEKYLYSEFDAEADYDTAEVQQYKDETVFINFDVSMKKTSGAIEEYSINKDTAAELLQDENNFVWEKGKGLTLKPIVEKFKYKHYETHVWESPVILFSNPLNLIDTLNVNYLNTDGTNTGLDLYIRSFNLEAGEWTQWIPFDNDLVPNIVLSSAYQIKVELSATETHTEIEQDDYLCCYLDWVDYIDSGLSKNITTETDHITTGIYDFEGIAISKIIQYGCPSGVMFDMYTSNDNVIMEVAYSNDIDDLILENAQWHSMSSANLDMEFKYYRFRILIPKGEKVYWVHLTTRTLESEVVLPYIQSIAMSGSHVPVATTRNFMKLETFKIPADGMYHKIISKIGDIIGPEVVAKGFDLTEITKIDIKSMNPNTLLLFDTNILGPNPNPDLLQTSLQASTSEVSVEVVNQQPYIFTKDNKITIKATPQQYSPITVEDINGIPLKQIYNVNPENMLLTEIHTMHVKENYIELKRNDFELETMTVWINDDTISNYKIVNHLMIFNNYLNVGDVVTVTYKVKNSFFAEIDRKNNTTVITTYTDKVTNALPDSYDEIINGQIITHKKKFKVTFETNKNTNKFVARKLSLNPVYRTDYSGFIYLTEEHNIPHKIKIWCNPKRVKAGGLDSVDIQIEVLDIINNPIIGKEITIDCNNGTLECDNYETDMNGIVHAVYKSSYFTGIDTVTAKVLLDDELTNLQESIEITSY